MNLADLIIEFREASGRLDLDDKEITKYLNRGSRLLDRRSHRDKIESRAHTALQAGIYSLLTDPDLRSIKQIWAMTADKRWQMAQIDFATMRGYYNQSPPQVTPGPPIYYSETSVMLGPGGDPDNPSSQYFVQWTGDILMQSSGGYRGLTVYPIPEELTVIEVIGNYFTPALQPLVGYDTNWWSAKADQLLIQAALITLDANYRNTAGAKDLYAFIDAELQELYYDSVEEDTYQASAMGGSEYGLHRRAGIDPVQQGRVGQDFW